MHKHRVVFHFTVRQALIDGRQLGTEDAGLGRQQLVPQGVLAIHRPRPPGTRDQLDPGSSPQAKRAYSSHRSKVPFRLYGMAPLQGVLVGIIPHITLIRITGRFLQGPSKC